MKFTAKVTYMNHKRNHDTVKQLFLCLMYVLIFLACVHLVRVKKFSFEMEHPYRRTVIELANIEY